MVAATFRQLTRLMIMYTANTASSGSPTERMTSERPSRAPMSMHRPSDGAGIPQQQRDRQRSRNRNGTSAMIRCSSWISNPS
jgi:hypothetical protein